MSMRLNRQRIGKKRLYPSCSLGIVSLHFAPISAPRQHPVYGSSIAATATVYLFGTVHMLPVSTHWQSPSIEHAMDLSDEIWTEADTSSLPALVRLIRRYGLSPQGNLRSVLPKRYRARYDMEMSSAGLSVDTFGHVKPWLAELLLTGGALKHARFGHGVETDLLAFAHRHNKATPTFETADEQFAILADLPIEAQIRALELQIDGYSGTAGDMNAMVKAWLRGDVVTTSIRSATRSSPPPTSAISTTSSCAATNTSPPPSSRACNRGASPSWRSALPISAARPACCPSCAITASRPNACRPDGKKNPG